MDICSWNARKFSKMYDGNVCDKRLVLEIYVEQNKVNWVVPDIFCWVWKRVVLNLENTATFAIIVIIIIIKFLSLSSK